VYRLPREDDKDVEKRTEFLVFYMDDWLVRVAGHENYKPEIRHYRMPVQTMEVAGETKKAQHISKESEGHGIVILKNCYSKWKVTIPQKLANSEWKVPEYNALDPNTHKYHQTRWSDGRNGQVKGGGWAPEAYDELSTQISRINAFRKEDKSNGWIVHRKMLEILRKANNVTEKEPTRKRKRRGRPVEERVYNDVVEMSDVEFSEDEEE
jgi:hypothetical protein